jgi:hypothetical protein
MSEEKKEFKYSLKKTREILESAVATLRVANQIIVNVLDGKPIGSNNIENYYSNWDEILTLTDAKGILVDGFCNEWEKENRGIS